MLHEIPQQNFMLEIETKISRKELKKTITKLSNGKPPGLNNVPPDAFEALYEQNLLTLMNFFNSYWLEETDFT